MESLMHKIFHFMKSENLTLKREALYVVCNVMTTTNQDAILHHIVSFNNLELIPFMISALTTTDSSLTLIILETLNAIF